MGQITQALLNLHGPVIYGVVAALVFAEAALFVGFVFPGETAVVVAGVLASQHRVSLPVLLGVIVLSAVVGDSVGYEVGRRFGDRLLDLKPVSRHRAKVDRAHGLLRRRGAYAVFIGRFTALLRAMMPALAGSARMPYGRFLVFNALGGICWGAGFATGGFLVGTAFEQVAQWAGRLLAIALGALAAAALLVWAIRRRRRERAGRDRPSGRDGESGDAATPAGRPDAGEGEESGRSPETAGTGDAGQAPEPGPEAGRGREADLGRDAEPGDDADLADGADLGQEADLGRTGRAAGGTAARRGGVSGS